MIKPFLLTLTILSLSACATRTKYVSYLNSWKGASEKELVETFGIPDGTYEKNGWKYLTYNRQTDDEYCKTVFIIENGKIIKWTTSGNDCKSDKTSR